jgi:hypothetical protein
MILSNRGYNTYGVWITNGINEVSLVPAFQMALISYPGLDR